MKIGILTVLGNLHKDESGQDLVEYALVAAMIALGSITGMQTLASSLNSAFSRIGSSLSGSFS